MKPARSVLVVDDDVLVATSVARAFERAGMHTFVAHTFGAARDLLREHAPDGAVIDLCLPDMVGHKLVPLAFECNPSARVVLVSGFPQSDAFESALHCGAHLLSKPYDTSSLSPFLLGETDRPRDSFRTNVEWSSARSIADALRTAGGEISQAARLLGTDDTTLRTRIAHLRVLQMIGTGTAP